MGVCRYFQQGRCRYGEKCRYEHPTGGVSSPGQQVHFRDSFGVATNQQHQYKWTADQDAQQTQSNAEDVINGLPKEMQTWEQSKMWPFSCVALEKEMPSLPDFYDISPEELRLQAYSAMKDGTLQAYVAKFAELVVDYNNKRQQLKLPSLDLKEKLIQLLEQQRKKESSSVMKSSTFGASASSPSSFGTGTSLFGKPAESSSTNQGAFGSSSTNQGAFGSSSTNRGAFGSSSTNQGLFGQGGFASGDSSTSIFGGGSGGFSISDSADTTTTAAGLFGSPTPTSTFGAGASPLSSFGGSATKTNLFGAGAGAFGGGTFGGSPQASPGPSTAGQGIGSPASPPSGLFGRPVTTATGASTQGQTTPQIGGRSLFGAAAATPQQQDGSRSTVYTPLDQLTEEEKSALPPSRLAKCQ
ncbi:nuclear pore complex protein DDB_G0274915-like [Gigantopelta aegis]|uniref:nuclear pore complex protein DDB_G0274915-like n=1 Tax=Gigantopelta aegis TaxID=1735272 RepID=UPI001B88AE43|nr:nuclear pore complex protein DDB_G0274915-like [Gigantopelta aegis]